MNMAISRVVQAAEAVEREKRRAVVSLPEMTQKAIDILSQDPEGFFLMVEEEGKDEMAHQSNAGLVIKAGQQLDETVKVGQSFAQSDSNTLVIVAADHETGSLAIEDTNEIQSDPAYPNESGEGRTAEDWPFRVANSDKRFLVDWTTTNHTAEDVPVTAMGPGGQNLVGVYQNTHIYDAMLGALFGSTSHPPQSLLQHPRPPLHPLLPLALRGCSRCPRRAGWP
jgi:alkaline phosphatase